MLDLVEVAKVEIVEPSGWVNVDLDSGKDDSVRAFMLQVRNFLGMGVDKVILFSFLISGEMICTRCSVVSVPY